MAEAKVGNTLNIFETFHLNFQLLSQSGMLDIIQKQHCCLLNLLKINYSAFLCVKLYILTCTCVSEYFK